MNQDKQSELLPCPFCGGEPEHRWHTKSACWIECSSCGAVGPSDGDTTTEQNVAAWNRRAPKLGTLAREVLEFAGDIRWLELGTGAPFTMIDRQLLYEMHHKARSAAIVQALSRPSPDENREGGWRSASAPEGVRE